jgi:tRNA(Ile)-lysidine synthase
MTADGKGLKRRELSSFPLALQRRVILKFLAQNLPKSPNFNQIEEVVSLISAPNKACTSSLPGKAIAQVENEIIKLQKCPLIQKT